MQKFPTVDWDVEATACPIRDVGNGAGQPSGRSQLPLDPIVKTIWIPSAVAAHCLHTTAWHLSRPSKNMPFKPQQYSMAVNMAVLCCHWLKCFLKDKNFVFCHASVSWNACWKNKWSWPKTSTNFSSWLGVTWPPRSISNQLSFCSCCNLFSLLLHHCSHHQGSIKISGTYDQNQGKVGGNCLCLWHANVVTWHVKRLPIDQSKWPC